MFNFVSENLATVSSELESNKTGSGMGWGVKILLNFKVAHVPALRARPVFTACLQRRAEMLGLGISPL